MTGDVTLDSGGALNAIGSVMDNGSLVLDQNTTFPTLTPEGRSRDPPGVGDRIAVARRGVAATVRAP